MAQQPHDDMEKDTVGHAEPLKDEHQDKMEGESAPTQGLKRDLHARHINMIALAGMIVSHQRC
jgi:amino acid permease